MSHIYTTELLIDDSGERHVRFTRPSDGSFVLASKDDFTTMVSLGRTPNEDHSSAHTNPTEPAVFSLIIPTGTDSNPNLSITEVDLLKVQNHFHPGIRIFNPETDNEVTSGTDAETTPELQLVQDPVIYVRPETGLSQKNVPFFRFHNPNGKSAITISMADVSHTRFDSLNDDTHQFVVITKALVEIRCVSTVAEQRGLEFRFRGVTHIISAAQSDSDRVVAESVLNPQ